MNGEEKNGRATPKNDITADELLVLLNKSVERSATSNGALKNRERKDGKGADTSRKIADGALSIDDSVYRVAEDKLHKAEAFTAHDDSDLDVDALMEKFINQPKREREIAAAIAEEATETVIDETVTDEIPTDEIVAEESAVEEIFDEAVAEDAVDEIPEAVAVAEDAVDEIPEAAAVAEDAFDEIPEAVAVAEDAFDEIPEAAAVAEEIVEEQFEEPEPEIIPLGSDLYEELLAKNEEATGEAPNAEAEENVPEGIIPLGGYPEVPASENADNVVVAEEASKPTEEIYEDDDDIITVPESAETAIVDANAFEETEDSRKTTEFDISLIKKAADDDVNEVDRLFDEAFDRSETEVFSPVADEDGEPEIPSQTYGENTTDEIDQTDLNLMLAFGMEEELKDTVGEEKAGEIEDDIIRKHEETEQMQSVADKIEFTDYVQTEEIFSAYKSKYYALIIRIAAAIAMLVGIFLVENFSLIGFNVPHFMKPSSYPVVYAMIDLQLVVLCGALVWEQVVAGVKSIIALKPTPESITAFAIVISALYTLIAGFIAPVNGFGLYNLPIAFTVLAALVYEFLNLKREVLSFNVVSTKRRKFVITPVSDATESLEREVFKDFLPADSKIVKAGKTDFVDGFFARSSEGGGFKPIIGIIIPVVIILSALFMILSFATTGSIYKALTAAFMTTVFTMPITAFMVYSYPFYKASKDAFKNDSAIIGEGSLAEYAESSVISFEDKEVFPSGGVKVTSIKVYGNNRIDEIIYSMASAFMKVGGPLADVFSQATHDLGSSDDVELIEVDDDGFTVTVDDVQVYIGKSSYMEKKDYDIPFDAENRKQEQSGTLGVLFVAYGGQLAAKVYVKYTIDNEFESILAQLYKTGMCVGIKSFDPNIDDLLLAKKIKAMKYPVKVIRSRTLEDIPQTSERCESGIVSRRSVKALLKTVAACERVSRVIKTSLIIKVLAMIIGVAVMIFIHAFGDKAVVSSLYIMLYHLFWMLPVFIISKFLA